MSDSLHTDDAPWPVSPEIEPEQEEPPRAPPRFPWIPILLISVLSAVYSYPNAHGEPARRAGFACGSAIFPLALAALAWRMSGRSRLAAILTAVALGLLPAIANGGGSAKVRLAREQATAAIDAASEGLRQAAADHQRESAKDLTPDTAALELRIATVVAMRERLAENREVLLACGGFADKLAAAKVPEQQANEALHAFQEAISQALQLRMCDAFDRLLGQECRLLELLRRRQGHWQRNQDGDVVFAAEVPAADLDRFNDLTARMRSSKADLDQLREQLQQRGGGR